MSAAKSREHPTKIECVDCAKRPPYSETGASDPTWLAEGGLYRPRVPRKIDPRSLETHKTQPRCSTDWLAWRNGQRAKGQAARQRKRAGIDEETRQLVLELQGGACPCGRTGRRALSAEHDHELAREHDHPEDVACELCFLGFLCDHCNRDIIGYLTGALRSRAAVLPALRRIVAFLEDPPMRRLRRNDPRSTMGEPA